MPYAFAHDVSRTARRYTGESSNPAFLNLLNNFCLHMVAESRNRDIGTFARLFPFSSTDVSSARLRRTPRRLAQSARSQDTAASFVSRFRAISLQSFLVPCRKPLNSGFADAKRE